MLAYSMLYPVNNIARHAVSLDGMWGFRLDWDSCGQEAGWMYGIPEADQIPVPASFQDLYTEKDVREFAGDMWYQKDVFIPAQWKGNQLGIRFHGAAHRAWVYVNGKQVAYHEGGFLPFLADITDAVKYQKTNQITVRVNNELTETNLPCGKTVTLKNGKKMVKPYFDFFNYSGLQRSVSLVSIPVESVFDITTEYEISGLDGKILYQIATTGSHPVKVALLDAEGKPVAEAVGKEGVLEVKNAHFWEIRNAYLYDLQVQIVDGDTILDQYNQPVGIRTVKIEGTQILVNGRSVYLKGFGKHEDCDILGRGTSLGVMKRDFELMKWIGANCFRTAHYPYSEEIYQMADREGFLVIDEVPAVGMFESLMNFMEASTGKQTAFFGKDTTPLLLQAHLQAVEEMIVRDKNHPCVIAWSLFNEPETTDERAVPYFQEVFDKAHELDAQKRPRTFALIMNSLPHNCKCYQFSDMICLNRYYGWYISGGYEISNGLEQMRAEMDEWKALNLNRPFLFTEYGADTLGGIHKLPSVMWSQEYQEEYLRETHRLFDSYDFVKGELVWNFADFQTTEGILRVDGNKKGIFTRQRQPKEAAYQLKRRWESLPTDYKGNKM